MSTVTLSPTSVRWATATAAAAVLPLALVLPGSVQILLALCFAFGSLSALRARPLPRLMRALLTLVALGGVFWLFDIGFGARSFGRDAGSALLAAMLGLKLMEMHALRDARSTVVFSLFALMAAFLQDQGPVTLILALLAGLLSLAALARFAAEESPSGRRDPPALRQSTDQLRLAGRVLAYSLPLAVVAFFLFPRLASPLWGLPGNSDEARTGLSEEMSPGDITSLFLDDTPIMRVSFEGEVPAPSLLYFRGPVLSNFDGRRWTRGYTSALNPPAVQNSEGRVRYIIEQEPTERRYLFPLDIPDLAPEGTVLTYERSLRTPEPLNRLTRTRYISSTRYVLEPTLMRTVRAALVALPEGFNPRAVEQGRRWRNELEQPEAIVNAALQWFNAEFTYTLEPPLLGRDPVDDFLFNGKRGYCEHFSSAFVVLMRAAGIPARVVTGYQGGNRNPIGGYLIVRQSDAHAWAEVWLEGRGWVRIDPTSAVSPQRIEQGRSSLQTASAWRDAGQPLLDVLDWLRRGWNDVVLGFGVTQQQRLLQPFGIDRAEWRELGIALTVAGGLALALTLFLLLRPNDQRLHPVERAWRRFLRRCARAGAGKPAHLAPRQFAGELAALFPREGERFAEICRRYSDWAFAAPGLGRHDEEQLRRDLLAARPRR